MPNRAGPRPNAPRRGLCGDAHGRPLRDPARTEPTLAAACREAGWRGLRKRLSQRILAGGVGVPHDAILAGAARVSRWDGQVVLVTGAQGFIGSWLAERLLDEGASRRRAAARLRAGHARFRTDGLDEPCASRGPT